MILAALATHTGSESGIAIATHAKERGEQTSLVCVAPVQCSHTALHQYIGSDTETPK